MVALRDTTAIRASCSGENLRFRGGIETNSGIAVGCTKGAGLAISVCGGVSVGLSGGLPEGLMGCAGVSAPVGISAGETSGDFFSRINLRLLIAIISVAKPVSI